MVDFSLTINAENINVPYGHSDEILYLKVKNYLLNILDNSDLEIIHFGLAPDNTADNNDDLLLDGTYFRIIAYQDDLGIDLDSNKFDIINSFKKIVENHKPFWSTIFVEKGFIKEEVTIELLYQNLTY